MKKLQGRFFSLLAVSILSLCSTPPAFASADGDAREVRITSVQGDVRLSRGEGKHTNLDKSWEQAQGGELLEQGFAIATESGRAEIEFENGSTVYLAENSLLLFTELSAPRDRIVSRMSLPTGTATFSLQPVAREIFFIETPTDKLEITAPDAFFARMNAYLDATAITPQDEKGEAVTCNYILQTPSGKFEDASQDTFSARINIYIGFVSAIFSEAEEGQVWKLVIPKGQTMFFRGCEIVEDRDPAQAISSKDLIDWLSFNLADLETTASALRASGLAPLVPAGLLLQSLPNVRAAIPQIPRSQTTKENPGSAANHSPESRDWDNWVSSRVQDRGTITTAALETSELSAPIPGLADSYANGSFFPCEPYGTCWEPSQQQTRQAPSPQMPAPSAPTPKLNTPNTVFQPQTVEWTERNSRECLPDTFTRVSRVARTPQELDELLRQKDLAGRQVLRESSFSDSCLQRGIWIHHQGHYARVLTHRIPPICVGMGCKVVHPPRPVWVRVNGKLGFVPRHPNDVKGKPPVNLKNGIIIPPAKSGEPAQHLAWDPSQKVKFLDKTPKEFRSVSTPHLPSASAPKIQAHLMQEATHTKSLAADSHIVYDYKSHNFIMPANASAGAKSKEVAIGGITSHGGVRSFADGRSGHYAESFGHTSAAASYSGGGHNSGSSSGGGHGSGSYSSSSSYSHGGGGSSYSGGGGSSGSHSSGGGGSSASANSASSSSSSSSSSGGSSHGRP
jgi:hypothetical protein